MRIGIEMFGTQFPYSRNRGIGRYTRHFAAGLLARDSVNEYLLYCGEGLPTDHIPEAPNAVTRQLRPDPTRGEATLAQVMEHLAETNPDGLDVLIVCNPLAMSPGDDFDIPAKPLNGLKLAAVVYDLIVINFPEQYFGGFGEALHRYSKRLNRLRSYDALLAISEATRQDFLSLLGLAPDRVVTIGTASDGRFFVPDRTAPMPADSRALLRALGITRPFVFSVGGGDYRKNPWVVVEAFAMLPPELRRAHQLVLTFGLPGPERDRLRQRARDRGVDEQLVLTDQIPDEWLRGLYQQCAAFVFPSLYEGFGLPLLEAMHCGAAVIAGNNSSQVEVVGGAGLLFNAADAGELAARLADLLGDPGRARALRERAVEQARRFSWEATADRTLHVLTRPHAGAAATPLRPGRRRATRRRIAFFSPLAPLRSGVSDYSARLLEELSRRYAIDLYHDADYLPHIGLRSPEFGCYDHRLFERNAAALGYHATVYQMGNSQYHGYMYQTLLRHPGVVSLHDFGLADFHFWYARQPGVDGDLHLRLEFAADFGPGADQARRLLAVAAEAAGGMPEACAEWGYHLNGRILERAAAVIVHSPWCVEQVRRRSPRHVDKAHVVPFGATALDPSPEQRGATRARFGLPADALVIASLGTLHPTKLNIETIAAFAPLAAADPSALLIFVGDELDGGAARRAAAELGLGHRVRSLGHQPVEVAADLAAIADIGVGLHRPRSGGESPAGLMDLLRLGVPTIVSDVGPLCDYPDSVVCKLRMETEGLAGLTRALRELAADRPRREALGRAAWHYVQQNHAWPDAADSYEEIIERAVAGRTRRRAGGIKAMPGPRSVTSPERLQAAS